MITPIRFIRPLALRTTQEAATVSTQLFLPLVLHTTQEAVTIPTRLIPLLALPTTQEAMNIPARLTSRLVLRMDLEFFLPFTAHITVATLVRRVPGGVNEAWGPDLKQITERSLRLEQQF